MNPRLITQAQAELAITQAQAELVSSMQYVEFHGRIPDCVMKLIAAIQSHAEVLLNLDFIFF